MNGEGGSGWGKLLKEITDPWDWAFGIGGAAIGIGATVASSGADLGTSAAGGFTTGIAARRAAVASLQRRRLRRQADALKGEMLSRSKNILSLLSLTEELDLELSLWENRATTNESFSSQLDKLTEKLRVIVSNHARGGHLESGNIEAQQLPPG